MPGLVYRSSGLTAPQLWALETLERAESGWLSGPLRALRETILGKAAPPT